MKKPGSQRRNGGFTLVEIMIAAATASLLLLGVYYLAGAANILAAKSFAANITHTQSRNTLDRIQSLLQTAYTVPVPINDQGAGLSTTLTLTGSSATVTGYVPIVAGSSATITGTGAGVAFDRIIGSPYLVNVPAAGIPGNASSIQITKDNTAQIPVPPPQPNDVLSIYTTAILSGTGIQYWATLGTVTGTSTSGNQVTYTVNLSSPLKSGTIGAIGNSGTTVTGTLTQQVTNQQVVKPSAILLRPTALAIVYPTTSIANPPAMPELRYIDSYTLNGSNVNVSQGYSVLTNEIQPTVSPAGETDPNPSGFGIVQAGSQPFVSVILHIRSHNYDLSLANKQRQDFSTFMGVGSMIALKSQPPITSTSN